MPYIQRRPYLNETEYDEVVEETPYRGMRSFSNSGSIVMFFMLLLLAGWVLMGNNRSPRDFGINWGGGADVAVAAPADVEVRVEPTPRVVYRERPVTVPVAPVRRTAEATTLRAAETEKRPTPRAKDAAIVGYSWISAPRVNMRSGPGTEYSLVSVLDSKQMVAVLDKFELDQVGEVWSKISIESQGIIREGWINRSYLSY
ncbi:MAG: SH3 domain-containing protein [Acidobacteria bacterium]|nr:SH3 domain-containing protein [Acidobacteriota bacterium]